MKQNQPVKIIHTTGRNNCGGRCIIHAHVQNGRIIKLTTDSTQHAAACGYEFPLCACIRGLNYHKTFLGPNRLKYPLKRIGQRGEGLFKQITWQEAIDTISNEWIRIRDTYGPGSRYVHYATGISALMRGDQLAKRLLALDGGFLNYYNSYSSACIRRATELMYGTNETGNDLADWLNSNLIILLGHNPVETKFDSGTMHYLKKAKAKGIPIIIIDPRKSDTVSALNAEWIPIKPATDSALTDAMAYVIYTEHLQDQNFLDRCCIGFDEDHMPEHIPSGESYLSYLLGKTDKTPKTPFWAEQITGIPSERIINLARRYATANPAALVQGFGAQRNACGEQAVRGCILLACMTGNVGISGGWASGAADCTRHINPEFPMPENPYPMKIPVYRWTDAVMRGHEMTDREGIRGGSQLKSDIKMIINLAGNCLINQHGDINRTAEILKDTSKCEFILCSDLFMTASAKFADILLPGISMFEGENITMPWQYGDFIGFNNQVIEPLCEGRFEYDWLVDVADRLGLKEEFSQGRTTGEWLEKLYLDLCKTETELPDYSELKKEGIYRYKHLPSVIAFAREAASPEQYPFPTKSGKIEIFSESVYHSQFEDFFPAIPRYLAPPEGPQDALTGQYPLQLVGWHTKRRCHSIHDNNTSLHAADPQVLWMNPADATERCISDGDEVLIWNDRGRIQIKAHVTDRIISGVTALSQGAWYTPDKNGTDHAGSINVLTSLKSTPYARGNAQHTNLVQVKKVL